MSLFPVLKSNIDLQCGQGCVEHKLARSYQNLPTLYCEHGNLLQILFRSLDYYKECYQQLKLDNSILPMFYCIIISFKMKKTATFAPKKNNYNKTNAFNLFFRRCMIAISTVSQQKNLQRLLSRYPHQQSIYRSFVGTKHRLSFD